GTVNQSCKFEQAKNVGSNLCDSKFFDKDGSRFCIITGSSDMKVPDDFTSEGAFKNYKKISIIPAKNERELLTTFLDIFHQSDPDIVLGHDLVGFDYKCLLTRFVHYKIP